MSKPYDTVAIVVAAGSGNRVGGDTPKQYLEVQGKAMLYHSYKVFAEHKSIDQIYVVIGKGQEQLALSALTGSYKPVIVTGGTSRRESVLNGLRAIDAAGGANRVLIHDAARPFLSAHVVDRLLLALDHHEGAVPALPVVDSLARGTRTITSAIDREGLWRIQTPQAFSFVSIWTAHQNWDAANEATDDARMLIASGGDVALIDGDEALAKYTFLSDFKMKDRNRNRMTRIGTGFDVHRLVAGEQLWLCGIKIAHTHGLLGHSDADVALHALTDAILGALALGDIGDHFPPSDPRWRGASSDQFVSYAMKLASDRGYMVGNVDLTIICEAPKLSPHRGAMRMRLAEILDSDIEAVSVKATTTEQLGFTGRGEGIAAQAAVILISTSGV